MAFALSDKSKRELEDVHTHLKALVAQAITFTEVDFMVFEGHRSLKRQHEYVAAGVSHTMSSRHLTGHAVDLVPIVDGQPRWEMGACFKVADAMRKAAHHQETPVRWGACWDMLLTDTMTRNAEEFAFGYMKRQLAIGRKPFLDGVHFELPRRTYP